MRIAFLGGGNMASALIGGLLKKGVAASSISVVELSPAARERLAARHGVRASTAPDAATQKADTLVLAVKPQDLRPAAAALAGSVRGKLVVSIAAGVRLDALSRWLGGHRKLVRCMPNTPALIGAGISGLYALPEVSDVTIDVFNMLGQLISRQALRMQGPGEASATFDARALSSGVYPYQVRMTSPGSHAERASFSGKMILLK